VTDLKHTIGFNAPKKKYRLKNNQIKMKREQVVIYDGRRLTVQQTAKK
jgi:hypothetical protein